MLLELLTPGQTGNEFEERTAFRVYRFLEEERSKMEHKDEIEERTEESEVTREQRERREQYRL